MIRLIIHGAAGRMGQRLCALAADDDRFEVVGRMDRAFPSTVPAGGAQTLPGDGALPEHADAIVDFSSDEGAREAASLAAARSAALLVGTTGLSARTADVLEDLARSVPVMIAPNTSRGVAVLNHVVGEAARLLGERYEVDLVEQHHHHKRDAPSGTALRLLSTLEAAGRPLAAERVHCIRAGDIVGDHDVLFAGPGERLRLAHSAVSRDVFVAGALDAVAWLASHEPGRYTIEQSLGLG